MSEMEVLRKFDLTAPMAPFLDVHMVNPLLDFIREVRTQNSTFQFDGSLCVDV